MNEMFQYFWSETEKNFKINCNLNIKLEGFILASLFLESKISD